VLTRAPIPRPPRSFKSGELTQNDIWCNFDGKLMKEKAEKLFVESMKIKTFETQEDLRERILLDSLSRPPAPLDPQLLTVPEVSSSISREARAVFHRVTPDDISLADIAFRRDLAEKEEAFEEMTEAMAEAWEKEAEAEETKTKTNA
jgi:hypothetical protein